MKILMTAFAACAVLVVTGCAVVPYGPPVGVGVHISGGSGHHHHHHHRGHRGHRWR